jgi:hypothetical protein
MDPASLGTVPINTSPFRVIYTTSRLRPLFNYLVFLFFSALSIFPSNQASDPLCGIIPKCGGALRCFSAVSWLRSTL